MQKNVAAIDRFSPEYQEIIHEAWKQFIKGKPVNGPVPDHVLLGWQISKDSGVDPQQERIPPILNEKGVKKLQERYRYFLEAAAPILDMLEISIRDTPYMATLSVISGHVLAIVGDDALVEQATEYFHIVGAHRSVPNIGATAFSLSMIQCKPVQLIGREHFNVREHDWKCLSAPVFNEANKPIGALTLSSHITSKNTHTTLLAKSCAECISIRIRENALLKAQKRLNAVLELVHNSLPEPILAIQTDGRVTHANNKAMQHIIGQGRTISNIFVHNLFDAADLPQVNRIIKQGSPETLEARMVTPSGRQTFICQFEPVLVDNKKSGGATVTVQLEDKLITLANRVGGNYASFSFDSIKGKSPVLRQQIEWAKRAAQMNSRVLIFGESGTGKELFAQAIHNASPVRSGPFVAVSCAAIPRDLIESELFGYVDGAFTGAKRGGLIGKFELANGGTLFLDEINSLPLDMQSKLLRVMQQMEIVRLGSAKPTPVDVRIICATNKKLLDAVRQGAFRADLYFRINVVEIVIPPLRERAGDIELLTNIFLKRQSASMNLPLPRVLPDTLAILCRHSWPGNVRELENVCERSLLMATESVITPDHLPPELMGQTIESVPNLNEKHTSLEHGYRYLIQNALSSSRGNLTQAAQKLGIARTTLYRRMRSLGIENIER